MTQAKTPPAQNGYSELGHPTDPSSQDDGEKEVIPEIRKPKIVWKIVCFFVVVGIVFEAIYHHTKVEYHETPTDGYYRKVENKYSFPRLINLGFVLVGLFLVPIFDCLFNVVEEFRYYKSHYNGNIWNLFKDCFSGIAIKVTIGGVLLVGIPCFAVKRSSLTLDDGMLIISCFGVGRFMVWLFDLKALSKADRSRDNEKGDRHPIDGVAWNFCVNLKNALPIFNRLFTDITTPVQDRPDEHANADAQPKVPLHINKMILLFSHKYEENIKLHHLDNHAKPTDFSKSEDGYEFPVYSLRYCEKEYRCVVQYAEEPLRTLREMFGRKSKNEFKEQVQLLYTKVSNILTEKYCSLDEWCILVLMTNDGRLENGGLVKRIMSCVPELPGSSYVVNVENTEGTENLDESSALIGKDQKKSLERGKQSDRYDGPDKKMEKNNGEQSIFMSEERVKENNKAVKSRSLLGKGNEPRQTVELKKYNGQKKAVKRNEQQPTRQEVTASVHYDPGKGMKTHNVKQPNEEDGKETTSPPLSGKGNEPRQTVEFKKYNGQKNVKRNEQQPTPHEVTASVHYDPDMGMKKHNVKQPNEEDDKETTSPPLSGKGNEQRQQTYGMNSRTSENLGNQSISRVMKDDGRSKEVNSEETLNTSDNQPVSGRMEPENQPTSDETFTGESAAACLDGVERDGGCDANDSKAVQGCTEENGEHNLGSLLVGEGTPHLDDVERGDISDISDITPVPSRAEDRQKVDVDLPFNS